MLHNHFIEGQRSTGCGTAPTKQTPSTSVNPLPGNLIRPEDRIKAIKRRITTPTTTRQVVEIETPAYDPTIRKKTRYEHSLNCIVKKNPRVTATIQNIRSNKSITDSETICNHIDTIPNPEPVEETSNIQNDLVCITDSASNTSSKHPLSTTIDNELEKELPVTIAPSAIPAVKPHRLTTSLTVTVNPNHI